MPTFRASWRGDREFVEALRRAAREGIRDAAVDAVGQASLDAQTAMRAHADRLIYMQPPSPNYTRTGRLRRSIRASRPDADRSADHDSALSADLAATDPRDVAAPVQGGVASEVGSAVEYAEYVEEGARGVPPRPFVEQSIPGAEDALERRIRERLDRLIMRL